MIRREARLTYYEEMMQLRYQEITDGINEQEIMNLRRLCKKLEIEEDYFAYQLESDVTFQAFKNVDFEQYMKKRSFVEVIKNKEKKIYYRIIPTKVSEAPNYIESYSFALELKAFVQQIGLAHVWAKILPITVEMSDLDLLNLDEVNWLKQLPSPKWCANELNRVVSILEKAKRHSEEMYECIAWLQEHWNNGFMIYLDCTSLGYMEA